MANLLNINPSNPQARLLHKAISCLQNGGLIVYPTDSCYAFGCTLGNKEALERIARIRSLSEDHHFTLVCRDLSDLATYAVVDNATYRFLRAHIPGPYTFLLPGTKEVPRRLLHPKRKGIGLRVPDHAIAQALLEQLGEPLLSSTVVLPGDPTPLPDAASIQERIGKQVDLIIDGGPCGTEPTTVIELYGPPVIVRQGKGQIKGA
jgi:tRNA threonylcarbamoyl adenosine modification protein (Sua5/YciO/YrdC/YwlC family)